MKEGQTESQTERQQFMQLQNAYSNLTVTFSILQLGRKSKLFSYHSRPQGSIPNSKTAAWENYTLPSTIPGSLCPKVIFPLQEDFTVIQPKT